MASGGIMAENRLPDSLFKDPVWHALQTKHRHLATYAGEASRYPADVAPFATVNAPTAEAMRQLCSLLVQGESVWVIGGCCPEVDGLSIEGSLECLQMALPDEVKPPPKHTFDIVPLTEENGPEMVALTDLAFPGFFRSRTYLMGSYYGVRQGGELIAMGGERLMLEGYSEISGVCTNPAHRGRGLASSIIWRLVADHRRVGVVSWLHVVSANRKAIELYLRMGFETVRSVTLQRVSRCGGLESRER